MTTAGCPRSSYPGDAPGARGGHQSAAARLPAVQLVAYGLFGMPLAMAALPLYVHLPNYYAARHGVDLALLGLLLLALRLGDAFIDPYLGALSDRAPSRRRLCVLAAVVLALGMIAVFRPWPQAQGPLLLWLAASLAIVYLALSLATISHGAWGAELSGDTTERTRITAVREGLALVGVVLASLAPVWLAVGDAPETGMGAYATVFAVVALGSAALLRHAPAAPAAVPSVADGRKGVSAALADRRFRALLVVFLVNGVASAVPATLVLFFIADVLGEPQRQGLFLALYFVAGAAGMPLWVWLSRIAGKTLAWGIGMTAAIAAFVWAWALGPGDTLPFAIICLVAGATLGADLALPPSVLADVIGRSANRHATGAYFGVWTLANKLALALAAGVALPLLAALGYTPGARAPEALAALAFVYALVPCLLKMLAIGALLRFDSLMRKLP